ncbi:hypothetical protein HYW17_04385 [Candidatus Uhrbacteria bacterium]|nr:hypothetical protein [Candidatus Uhrbacteria bacterium]
MPTGEGSGPKHNEGERFQPYSRVIAFLESIARGLEDDQEKIIARAGVRTGERVAQSLQQLVRECRAARKRLETGDAAPAKDFLNMQLAKFKAAAKRSGEGSEKYQQSITIIGEYEQMLGELEDEDR